MGLLYTKFYLDFDEDDWNQILNDPIIFQTKKENVTLEIDDASHNCYKLLFKAKTASPKYRSALLLIYYVINILLAYKIFS